VKTLDLNNGHVTNTEEWVTEAAIKETSLRVYPPRTVVVAMYGGFNQIGRTGLLQIPAAVNQALTAVRPNEKVLDPRYLLESLNLRVGYWRTVASSSRKDANITGDDVRAFPVRLPPLPEQKAIATALADVDALLGALDGIIAKRRDLKQAAMEQLLTAQIRLPGFAGKWATTTLGRCLLARPDYGINAAAVPLSDRLPKYIRITDITKDGRFRPDAFVSVMHANAKKYYLNEGDLVFARTGASVGKSYLYNSQDGRLVFAGFLIRVRPDPSVLDSSYLAAYARTEVYWRWVRLMSMRSGQPGINGNEYAQLEMAIPPTAEQVAIARVLKSMDDEILALEQRRDKTRQLKQGMMQELLTGRTRLL
jgi:type I restriction enzyme S subunit